LHKSRHLTHPAYRSDIDGLRAIAVLSVVGFHAFPNWIKGGFIGVDIFFVISGFLISIIILGSLERNEFSFAAFYSRRIKRIFPALLLVLSACYAFGWFALLADEYKQLGKHIAGGAGFVSNFILWNENGYFDNSAETKPLLHLWSLGIEEQFYIIWPSLLWLAWKLRLNLLTVILAVAAISFALNIGKVHSDAAAAFYSPQTRFWELSLGSVLAYIGLNKPGLFGSLKRKPDTIAYTHPLEANADSLRNTQSVSGAALIAASIFLITKDSRFPGWYALLPTLGTALIISAGAQAWLNRVILSHRVLVWFGLISFPLYLWHWPLLSFARLIESEVLSRETRIALVFSAIILAWLTYILVERPIRSGAHGKVKTIALFFLMALVGYAGFNCFEQNGLSFRLKDRKEYAEYFENSLPEWKYFERNSLSEKYRYECNLYDVHKYRIGQSTKIPLKIATSCFQRNSAYDHSVLLWGDSHAQHLYFGLKNHLPPDWQILQIASSGCLPDIAPEDSETNYCVRSNWLALKTIKDARPDTVIVAQNVGHDYNQLNKIALLLQKLGIRRTLFIGPTPHWTTDLPKIIITKLWLSTPRRTYVGLDKEVLDANAVLQQNLHQSASVIFVNLIDFFCNNAGCLIYLGDDKKTGITSYDYGHLTSVASDYLAQNLLVDAVIGKNIKSTSNPVVPRQ
jgi:peptidoglycan/LPS O-acetylase OafA/YrhL